MINPELHRLISYSLGGVSIVREDEPAEYHQERNPCTNKDSIKLDYGGEEYRCNCPFCGDTKGHLYINHLYGSEIFGEEGMFVPWLAYCHHGCLSDRFNRIKLNSLIFGFQSRGKITVKKSSKFVSSSTRRSLTRDLEQMDNTVPLESLPEDHHAVNYLCKERNYSIDLLKKLHIGYCAHSEKWRMIQDKIIIPIYFNGRFSGWQARCIGKPEEGRPKYYTQPGLQKSALLYNYDIAKKQDYVLIMEGVTDVWRAGDNSVCGFGKFISVEQKTLLCKLKKPLVVFLDNDAIEDAKKLYSRIESEGSEVYLANVPAPYTDPGETPQEIIQEVALDLIRNKCKPTL